MTVTIVTGWPRSGTTAMMRTLRDAGLPLAYDFEASLELAPSCRFGWPDGCAVKVWPEDVRQLRRGDWRVIVMRRDPAAVHASWSKSGHRWPWVPPPADMALVLDELVVYLQSRSDVVVHEAQTEDLRRDESAVLASLS